MGAIELAIASKNEALKGGRIVIGGKNEKLSKVKIVQGGIVKDVWNAFDPNIGSDSIATNYSVSGSTSYKYGSKRITKQQLLDAQAEGYRYIRGHMNFRWMNNHYQRGIFNLYVALATNNFGVWYYNYSSVSLWYSFDGGGPETVNADFALYIPTLISIMNNNSLNEIYFLSIVDNSRNPTDYYNAFIETVSLTNIRYTKS